MRETIFRFQRGASDSIEIFEQQLFCMLTLLTKTCILTRSIMKEKPVSTVAKHL